MKVFIIYMLFTMHNSYSQVSLRKRSSVTSKGLQPKKITLERKSVAKPSPTEIVELEQNNSRLDVVIDSLKQKPGIWDFTSLYDLKTSTVIKGKLLNSIVSTNLESPLVIEVVSGQQIPEGTLFSCLGQTKFKRVIAGCNRMITPGANGDEYDVEVSVLNRDGSAGLTGEFYSGKELYVAGMIASSFARGSIELSQSRISTAGGEMKINSAKNRYLEGVINSADEITDLMKKEMQTNEPKVFIPAGREVLIYFNSRFKQ